MQSSAIYGCIIKLWILLKIWIKNKNTKNQKNWPKKKLFIIFLYSQYYSHPIWALYKKKITVFGLFPSVTFAHQNVGMIWNLNLCSWGHWTKVAKITEKRITLPCRHIFYHVLKSFYSKAKTLRTSAFQQINGDQMSNKKWRSIFFGSFCLMKVIHTCLQLFNFTWE